MTKEFNTKIYFFILLIALLSFVFTSAEIDISGGGETLATTENWTLRKYKDISFDTWQTVNQTLLSYYAEHLGENIYTVVQLKNGEYFEFKGTGTKCYRGACIDIKVNTYTGKYISGVYRKNNNAAFIKRIWFYSSTYIILP